MPVADSTSGGAPLRIRLFAAAKAALGVAEVELPRAEVPTIAAALTALAESVDDPSRRQTASTVLARCSFLVDRNATTDAQTPLSQAALLDVLPPFAGG